jgi:hypothetical protein
VERHRLETESPELAARFRTLDEARQRAVVEAVLNAGCRILTPPLALPDSSEELDELRRRLDYSETGDDFLRSRAAASALDLARGLMDDALYEALHAHRKPDDGVAQTLRAAE